MRQTMERTLLLDMDGVLADFDAGFCVVWASVCPDGPQLDQLNRKSPKIAEEFPSPYREKAERLFRSKGFYRSLPLVRGAKNILDQLSQASFDVWICTRPHEQHRFCVPEKYAWVETHYGVEWTRRIIMTRDKTMVRGDLLLDDLPEIPGNYAPTWRHILFDAPYNRHIEHLPRISWRNWRSVLLGG